MDERQNNNYRIAYIVPNQGMMDVTRDILKDDIASGSVKVLMIDVYHMLSEYRRLCSEGYN
ncbi:MAG: hypothetical protein ACFNYI_08035, partial [Eubacterium sp.]